MNDLNDRILKNFKGSVAISNLKEECIMKKTMRKQVITLFTVSIVFLSGGFLTVNAATGGELVDNIKSIIFQDAQNKINTGIKAETFEIEDYETDDEENITSSTYTFEGDDGLMYKVYDVQDE